jgi:hypothetical protein
MTAAIPAGTASAMDRVPCGNADYLRVTVHTTIGPSQDFCYANAGAFEFHDGYGRAVWITGIWTGNNRVQWHGDGRWQPDSGPIGKWTTFTWPNNPGGVSMDQVRIL